MAMIDVAAGDVATIVTWLEMRERPDIAPPPASALRLTKWDSPTLDRYRALFARVGTPWLWASRLAMQDNALESILGDPATEVHVPVDASGGEVGLLELDFSEGGECQLSFFGLIPELTGAGHGRWLMAQALTLAWREGVSRVWVHTCSLDHPSALSFYRRLGFTPYKRAIETFPDPRRLGLLPIDAAPQIPLL